MKPIGLNFSMTLVEADGKFYKVEIDENILKTPGMFLG
jgi:hypothetical protein